MNKRLGFFLKLAISAGTVAFILSRADLASMGATLRAISWEAIAAGIGLSLLQNVICTYRWMWIMRVLGCELRFGPAWQACYIGMFLGQWLPSFVGGDAYRIYWLYQNGQPLAQAVRGVLLDRVSAFLALVLMLAVGVPWIMMRFHDARALSAVWAVLLCGLGGSVVLFSGDVLPYALRRFRPLAELATLSATARRVLLHGSTGVRVTGVSVIVHTLSAVAMFIFAQDMHLPVLALDCFVLIPLLMLFAALPISIAGWGVREGVMVAALSLLGVQAEKAVVLSVLIGCMALFNGLIGAIPLALGKATLGTVPSEARG